jgi:hypothetical protein
VGLLRGGDRAGDGGGDPVAVAGGQQVEQGAAEQGEELGAAGRSVVAGAFCVALVLPRRARGAAAAGTPRRRHADCAARFGHDEQLPGLQVHRRVVLELEGG